MIPKPRSLRVLRNPIGLLILLAAAAAAAGCTNANTPGGGGVDVNHVDASGNSIPGWLTPTGGLHTKSATLDYIANGGSSSCTECHGSDLAGGISRVSCFANTAGCHHGPIPNWSTAAVHGATAKLAPGSSGFASCQICHGADFRTVRGGITCFTCHVSAPHAPAPWRASAGTTFTHTTTDNTNAPVCYQCHSFTGTENPNNPHVPPTPASAGTEPGCYNGTMCHNQAAAAPHITGSAWLNAGTGFHGTDAKSDLTVCQGCHGTPGTINFDGGTAPTACSTCHTASKAHPTDWQGLRTINGVTITHRTSGNRDVACAICHNTTGSGTGPNPSAPSCFSASFTNALGQARACHSGGPGSFQHPAGWALFTQHGSAAKAAPSASTSTGFALCQTCHGTGTTPPANFGGGTSGTSCYPCHGNVGTPHPGTLGTWRGVDPPTHRTTNQDPSNLNVCAQCHLNGANSPFPAPSPPAPAGTDPGCFNSTLCHPFGGA